MNQDRNFSIEWRLEDNENWVVISIYQDNSYWGFYEFPLKEYKNHNSNWTFKDQIETKIWGKADGLNEMWNQLEIKYNNLNL